MGHFARKAFQEKFYPSLEALQADLDRWLKFYNEERPHQGYRNMGKRRIDTINKFVNLSGKRAS